MAETKRLPVSTGEVLEALTNYAKSYHKSDSAASVLRNRHMNDMGANVEYIPQELVDAVVVDFINYIGACCGVDYALYTSDIK